MFFGAVLGDMLGIFTQSLTATQEKHSNQCSLKHFSSDFWLFMHVVFALRPWDVYLWLPLKMVSPKFHKVRFDGCMFNDFQKPKVCLTVCLSVFRLNHLYNLDHNSIQITFIFLHLNNYNSTIKINNSRFFSLICYTNRIGTTGAYNFVGEITFFRS